MDFSKLKLPILSVLTALGVAVGAGAAYASTHADQTRLVADVKALDQKVAQMEAARHLDREQLIEIRTIVRRIDRRMTGGDQ